MGNEWVCSQVKRMSIVLFVVFFITACGTRDKVYSEEKGRFIVKFEERLPEAKQETILGELGLKIDRRLDLIGALSCVSNGKFSYEELIQEAQARREIRYIEPDFKVQVE